MFALGIFGLARGAFDHLLAAVGRSSNDNTAGRLIFSMCCHKVCLLPKNEHIWANSDEGFSRVPSVTLLVYWVLQVCCRKNFEKGGAVTMVCLWTLHTPSCMHHTSTLVHHTSGLPVRWRYTHARRLTDMRALHPSYSREFMALQDTARWERPSKQRHTQTIHKNINGGE